MNELKRIIKIILIMILTIVSFSTKVYAGRAENQTAFFNGTLFNNDGKHFMNLDRKIKIKKENGGGDDVLFTLNSLGVYCIQDGVSARDGDYRVKEYIEIDGNTATSYGYKGGKKGTWECKNNECSKLTYVLYEGLYRKSSYIYKNNSDLSTDEKKFMDKTTDNYTVGVRNRAIWKYFPKWVQGAKAYLKFDNDWNHDKINSPNHELQGIANTFLANANYALPKCSSSYNNFSNVSGNVNLMGPFKINFKGTLNIKAYNSSGAEITDISFYSDNIGTKKINKSDITSGIEFYIKSTSNRIQQVKINASGKKRTAKIWLLKEDYDASNEWQDLMIAKCSSANYTSTTITLNFKYNTGNLNIYKKDYSSGDWLGGAKFKLYNNTYKQWLTGAGTSASPYSLGNTATEYTVDSNGTSKGKKIFTNLPIGKYQIYETGTPAGYAMTKQNGYDKTNNRINCGEVAVTNGSSAVEKTVYNKLRRFDNKKSRCR